MKYPLQEMLEYCEGLRDGTIKPKYLDEGLCYNFYIKFAVEIEKIIKCSLTKYPEGTGNGFQPVPKNSKNKMVGSSYKAYFKAMSNNTMWDYNTHYGKQRKKFMGWIAERIKLMLEEQEDE